MRLLVIEDEKKIADGLKRGLEELSYQVDVAHNGPQGLVLAQSGHYELVVLDRMLPGQDGLEVLRELRKGGQTTPVILLTAMDRVHDRVDGLQSGADDYLIKPFALAELSARIEAILRRAHRPSEGDFRNLADISICYPTQTVRRSNTQVELTPKEFRILCTLTDTPNQLVSRKELLKRVWDLDFETETNIVDVTVRRLRQKIDDPFDKKLIKTVRGAGYIFEQK